MASNIIDLEDVAYMDEDTDHECDEIPEFEADLRVTKEPANKATKETKPIANDDPETVILNNNNDKPKVKPGTPTEFKDKIIKNTEGTKVKETANLNISQDTTMETKDLSNLDRKRSLENLSQSKMENGSEVTTQKREDGRKNSIPVGNEREQKIFKPAPVERNKDTTNDKLDNTSRVETKTKKEKPTQLSLAHVNFVRSPGSEGSPKDWALNGAKPKQNNKPHPTMTDKDVANDFVDAPYYRLLSDDSVSEESPRKVSSSKRERRSKKGGKKRGENISESGSVFDSPEAMILLTNEHGIEKELKSTQNGGYSVKHGYQRSVSHNYERNYHTSASTSTSKTTSVSEDTSYDITTATTDTASEDTQDSEKVNNLLLQQELYKQRKMKPFQKLSKIKTGQFEVGIEGDVKRSLVKCFVILPDKKIILYDRNNKCLKLFDSDFNPLDKINIGVRFCSLAPIFVKSVVATMPETKQLKVFHITPDNNKILHDQTLPVQEELYSVSHFDDMLFVFQRIRKPHFTDIDDWQIRRMDLNQSTEKMKLLWTVCPGHKDCTLFANDQGLYFTNKVENEVLHLNHDGVFINRHKVGKKLILLNCNI